MAIVSFLVILSLSLLVLAMFTQGQDVLAYKGSGVDISKYGQATRDIVCGDKLCSEKLSIQERIDKYLWETRTLPTVESIISEIEQLQNQISKLTLQLQEIQGVDFSLQQQGLLSPFRGLSSPTISPLDPIKSSEFDKDEKIIESLENPEEQAFEDEGQFIEGGSLEFQCHGSRCDCKGLVDCVDMANLKVCGGEIKCYPGDDTCSCSIYAYEDAIESSENPEEQAFEDEGQFIEGGRGSDNIDDGGSMEFDCTQTECTCEGASDCYNMGLKKVCDSTISCTPDGSKCSCDA